MGNTVTDSTTASVARQHELNSLALLLEPRIAEGQRALTSAKSALEGAAFLKQSPERHQHAVDYLTAQQSLRTRLHGLLVDAQTRAVQPDEFRAAMGGRP